MQETLQINASDKKWWATLRAHHFEQVVPKGDFFFYLQAFKVVRLDLT